MCYDAPDPPDYAAAADEQGQANLEAARVGALLNRPNERTPLGSRTWTRNGDQFTSSISLSPTMQGLFDQQNRISQYQGNVAENSLGRVNQAFSGGFPIGQMPDVTRPNMPDMDARKAYADALLGRAEQRFSEDENDLRARLANQGITAGSEAWRREFDRLNDARTDARMQADLAAGDEMARQYGLEANQYGLEAADRARQIQEASFLRNLPLSELNALRTGAQPNMPQFQAYSPVSGPQATPIMQAAQAGYQGELGQYNAEQAAFGNMMNGLFSLGGAYLLGGR